MERGTVRQDDSDEISEDDASDKKPAVKPSKAKARRRIRDDAEKEEGRAKQQRLQGLFGNGELTPFEEDGYGRYTPGTVTKCDFCSQRVDAGLDPACVVTCPTNARIFGDLDDADSAPSKMIRERQGRPPMPDKNTKPKVFYVN